ncbi:MAG: hypothetical protein DMF94_32595 [Acidobacteria bacterium]|nr:MAG: hypothetical protein DMF94_32595 [Acidobacteriota bacterium]
MNLSTILARGRNAFRMTPRQLSARLRDELRQAARRPWSGVYPHVLRDATVIGESAARSHDDLWERQMMAPFFLNPSDRDRYAAAFRARYPDAVAGVIAGADAAVRHEFDLLGSGAKAFGSRLPWLDDFKTGRHYPLQYCRDITYMELDKATDVKVPWELSRCQHFTALGQAHWLTGDDRYAREYRAEIEDWIAVNPFAYSVNWACAMDVALRAISWIWGFYFMAGSQACADPGFRRALLRSLFMHGEFVFTHPETSDVNGNHYLSDGAGLVFLGLFFKHTARGRHWLARGRRIVCDEMFEQVSEDGVDFEQSTAYHRLVLELFFTSYLLLEQHGEPVPERQWTRLGRMLDFVAAYTKPSGLAPLIGDADDGRVQKLGTQAINDHRYLLSTGAVRFSRGDLKTAAHHFWDESFWLLGPDHAASFDRLQGDPATFRSVAFPAGGFYVLRSPSAHVVVDCGEVGMRGRGGHGHNDILSFELFLNGLNVVSDCGAYLYTASREWRNRFRSTAFHNVAQVDGEELNRFVGEDALWQLRDDAHPVGARWDAGPDGDYFRGGHDGYARLSPSVMPSREILLARRAPRVVVRDRIEGAGRRTIIWRFHFDPSVKAELADGDCRLTNRAADVWMLPIGDACGSWRLDKGWVSPSYGVRHDTSVLVIEYDGSLPISPAWLFAEARLPRADRQEALDRLDARAACFEQEARRLGGAFSRKKQLFPKEQSILNKRLESQKTFS